MASIEFVERRMEHRPPPRPRPPAPRDEARAAAEGLFAPRPAALPMPSALARHAERVSAAPRPKLVLKSPEPPSPPPPAPTPAATPTETPTPAPEDAVRITARRWWTRIILDPAEVAAITVEEGQAAPPLLVDLGEGRTALVKVKTKKLREAAAVIAAHGDDTEIALDCQFAGDGLVAAKLMARGKKPCE